MKLYRYLLLIAIIILAVSACAPTSTQNPPAPQATAVSSSSPTAVSSSSPTSVSSSNPTAVSAPTATSSTKTDAEMETLITEKVHDYHPLAFILSQTKTAEQWSVTIDRMIGRGAKITPEMKTLIITWLVNRKK
jgi:hypothetical protein